MSESVTVLGQNYEIPETPEEDWGDEMTPWCVAVSTGINSVVTVDGADNPVLLEPVSTELLEDDDTLMPETPIVRVGGDGATATLSATTSISDGTVDGQKLVLFGTSDTNTVTILHNSNVQLNGHVILADNDCIELRWSSTGGSWLEVTRSA